MEKCVDSSHEGNGCPGAGIVFPAVEKLLSAVDALIDLDVGGSGPSGRALALVTRRQGELIDASAKCDAKVAILRHRLASAEAERDRLREALTFYGSGDKWIPERGPSGEPRMSAVWEDAGERARAALKGDANG